MSQEICAYSRIIKIISMFPFKIFVVSAFSLSLWSLLVSFLKVWGKGQRCFFPCELVKVHLLKRPILPSIKLPWSLIENQYVSVYFRTPLRWSIDLYTLSYTNTHHFDYCNFIINHKNQSVNHTNLFFSFLKIVLAIQGPSSQFYPKKTLKL